jgi:phospholipid/cholesterol/gamma-HCH transport system permease protein
MPSAEPSSFRRFLEGLGDWTGFSWHALGGVWSLRFRVVIPIFYGIGVRSVGVVAITGVFIGMVLAVQAYAQFHPYGFDAAIGSISNGTILSELGPVLAAVMLAGRVGGSMAAELGTMRVTEQVDALACLGVDPVHHLVTPRFLACLLLIPLLTVLADLAGIFGSSFMCLGVYGIDSANYWNQTFKHVGLWEIFTGLSKSIVFGGALGLISCHRGFRCDSGAQGVGRAATEAFVYSFVAILILDFFLVYLSYQLRDWFAPVPGGAYY